MTDSSVRTFPRDELLTGEWPDDVTILISPGVAGGRGEDGAFADTARSVYDELEARGVKVAYATDQHPPDSVLVLESHYDWWGPVLTIGEGVVSGIAGRAIYDGIKEAIRRATGDDPEVPVHLDIEDVSEITAEGQRQVRTTSLSGDSKTVLDGLDRVLQTHTDGADREENHIEGVEREHE